VEDCATRRMRFETRTSLALEATFDGGKLTSDGALTWLSSSGISKPSASAANVFLPSSSGCCCMQRPIDSWMC
jgi:hypothetical protein